MIFIRLLVIVTLIFVRNDKAFGVKMRNSSNLTHGSIGDGQSLGYKGIDEAIPDRDWERYINDLKRLKLHEMKKAIRSRVLAEKLYPYFFLNHIRRRLKLLEMYDPVNVELGYVKNSKDKKSLYRTVSGQGIIYIKLAETNGNRREEKRTKSNRPIIVLVAGISGSDWIAVHAVIHILTHLATSYNNEKLLGFDWWIIPLLNPDGYISSMDNKILRNYNLNINTTSGCSGVNLDRNFLFQRESCNRRKKSIDCQKYPGECPFSEMESRALRDFISSRVADCKLFVALKEGAKALVYPFASNRSPPPGANSILQNLLCTEALEVFDESHTGKKNRFHFGNSGSIFGPSSGYVEDWAKRHMGISRSFAFYIANSKDRENESSKKIEEYGQGTLQLVKVLATSRKVEPYPESFDELIRNHRRIDLSNFLEDRPIPWGRELIPKNLRDKIKRGANLEMPLEFQKKGEPGRYENLDYTNKN